MVISRDELVHLSRLAVEGKTEDVSLYLRRLARKMRVTAPETSEALLALAKKQPSSASKALRGVAVTQLPVDLETRLELARVEHDLSGVSDPIWTDGVSSALHQVILERENEARLVSAKLTPAHSLLFVGPPGVGKTLSARWLASRLGRPLITLDLAAVMSSFLGRTGNNLRNVLDYAKSVNCVLLLDEFDAIAKRRDDVVEVGELKRLVTVLLQEIDNWPSSGILVAATNHDELLDPAIWRRFDLVVPFALPDESGVQSAISRFLGDVSSRLQPALAVAMKGMSFSDIERDLLRVKRQAVLTSSELDGFLEQLIQRLLAGKTRPEREAAGLSMIALGVSERKAHDLTSVSRDTFRKKKSQPVAGASDEEE